MKYLVSPQFGDPTGYELRDGPDLEVKSPRQVLIKVQAASINGHDVIMASGRTKAVQRVDLPYRLGLDFAGTVAAVGGAVNEYSPGDSVFGFAFHLGSLATQILLDLDQPHALTKIPPKIDFVQAASLPAVGVTAELALQRANEFFQPHGGLQGKTVFIPAALSGVGSIALQIAKHGWKCRTLTCVSTAKLSSIEKWLGDGVVDEAFDYTKDDIVAQVGKGAVDFVLDTTGKAGDYMPMIAQGGFCLSIARLPPGSALKEAEQSRTACIGQSVMDGLDAAFRTWAKTRYGVTYVYQKTEPVSAPLQALSARVQAGEVNTVVGGTAALQDLDQVRKACEQIASGKGGIGKFVVTM